VNEQSCQSAGSDCCVMYQPLAPYLSC